MKYNVVVATHHKTGTVWMDGVFKAIARDVGATYGDFKADGGRLGETPGKPMILLDTDSNFGGQAHLVERDDVRLLHVIRDPRDVLISGMHYHKRSGESWLHEPIPGFDNVTYQRQLRALPTKFDQYLFEMEHSTASTLRDVTRWQYGRPSCFEVRYEELRHDEELALWRRISAFLGFDAAEQKASCRRFRQNSLFGGAPRWGNRHIRSGAVAQWRREFTRDLGLAFIARFPGVLEALGYERDSRWISTLRPAR